MGIRKYSTNLVSVVLRIHRKSDLWQLRNAIKSLADQDFEEIQIIVCIQNGDDTFVSGVVNILIEVMKTDAIVSIFNDEGSSVGVHKVISVPVDRNADGRGKLLNFGIRYADGRFISILDFDDILYPNAFSTLVQQANKSDGVLVAGGCVKAICRVQDNNGVSAIKILSKENYLSKQGLKRQHDMFYCNFLPIHSYLINLGIASKAELYVREDVGLLEDYEMLLKLAAQYKFDLELIDVEVCEYRVREDGSNSSLFMNSSDEKKEMWRLAGMRIEEVKKSLEYKINVKELNDILKEIEILKMKLSEGRENRDVALLTKGYRFISRVSGRMSRFILRQLKRYFF